MSLLNESLPDQHLKKYAACASIYTALVLTLIKTTAAFITGSLSILSSMADSLADVVSSVVTFVAVYYADKPLTCDHRYGYGKAEAVSALVQAAFISGSACFILYEAGYRFLHPIYLTDTVVGVTVMIISMLLTALLVLFQRYVVSKIKSQAIEADSKHYIIDLLANGTVLLSLLIVHWFDWQWFDLLAAVIISIYLICTAWRIAQNALSEITDKELTLDIKQQIIYALTATPGVMGYHDFRSRLSGNRLFIEVHLELDGNLPLQTAHDISEQAEQAVTRLYPSAQVLIHQDPYGVEEKRIDNEIIGPCNL